MIKPIKLIILRMVGLRCIQQSMLFEMFYRT
ncbi:hypothetical protein NAS141_04118 [Sulfitobacter sp. NAS-14.1]|nr:hypothetical protein NAS141_04118 [Sulfitobacter sp. NAS-14.1]